MVQVHKENKEQKLDRKMGIGYTVTSIKNITESKAGAPASHLHDAHGAVNRYIPIHNVSFSLME
jgi:hypothetical protein